MKLHQSIGRAISDLNGDNYDHIARAEAYSDLYVKYDGEIAPGHLKEVIDDFDGKIKTLQDGDGTYKDEIMVKLRPSRDAIWARINTAKPNVEKPKATVEAQAPDLLGR